jgi:hypothetical protein
MRSAIAKDKKTMFWGIALIVYGSLFFLFSLLGYYRWPKDPPNPQNLAIALWMLFLNSILMFIAGIGLCLKRWWAYLLCIPLALELFVLQLIGSDGLSNKAHERHPSSSDVPFWFSFLVDKIWPCFLCTVLTIALVDNCVKAYRQQKSKS